MQAVDGPQPTGVDLDLTPLTNFHSLDLQRIGLTGTLSLPPNVFTMLVINTPISGLTAAAATALVQATVNDTQLSGPMPQFLLDAPLLSLAYEFSGLSMLPDTLTWPNLQLLFLDGNALSVRPASRMRVERTWPMRAGQCSTARMLAHRWAQRCHEREPRRAG